MGVPKLYKMAFSSIDGIHTGDIKNPFSLSCDLNGLLHKIAGYIYGYGKTLDNKDIDNDKIRVIMSKLQTPNGVSLLEAEYLNTIGPVLSLLIIEKINPTDVLIIAIDGIAELAKVIQQRIRRFVSGSERFEKESHGIKSFDTSFLTAGTSFMERVSDAVQKWIDENKSKLPKYVYFSPSQKAGEGEHKIFKMLDSIRGYEVSNNRTDTDKDKDVEYRIQNHVVYGLDADLGILTMMRDYNFIWLRESYDINTLNEGVSINVARDHFINLMKPDSIAYESLTKDQKFSLIRDFVLMTFKIGDDFVQRMFTLDCNIKTTLDSFCKAYKEYTDNEFKFITDNEGNINWGSYKYFLENYLIKTEENLYNLKMEVDTAERLYANDPYNNVYASEVIRLRSINKIKMNQYETYTPCSLFPMPYENFIEHWKKVMIRPSLIANTIFTSPKISMLMELEQNIIQESTYQSCQNYLTGLQWNLKYYMGYPVNNWFYQGHLSPTISNLVEFMNSGRFQVQNVIRSPVDPYINATHVLSLVLHPLFSNQVLKTFFSTDAVYLKHVSKCKFWSSYSPKKLSFIFQAGYNSDIHMKIPIIPQLMLSDILKISKLSTDYYTSYSDVNNLGTLTLGNISQSVFVSRLTSTKKVTFENVKSEVDSSGIIVTKPSNLEKQIYSGTGDLGRGDTSGRGFHQGRGRGDTSGRGFHQGRGRGDTSGRGPYQGRGRGDTSGRGPYQGRGRGRGPYQGRGRGDNLPMKVSKFKSMYSSQQNESNLDI
uniref:Xrn1 N-terminal domain-containing protein n=1 Tax=viral metagenome TaxID=1070528 RepID=A0A6C0BDX9_9ZZZZ